jgi:uncharacterized membrane protein
MKQKLVPFLSLAIVIASFIVAVIVYPNLPAKVPSHWNLAGEVDGYINQFWGAFLMPFISLGLYILFLIIPKIDPKRENIRKFIGEFNVFIFFILLFLAAIYAFSLLWSFGYHLNINRLMPALFAMLMAYIAVLVERAEPNYTIGIRTPWTLSSAEVWAKTHKLGGKLFKACAIIALVGIIVPQYAFYLVIIPIIAISVWLFIYSYLIFEKEKWK